MTKVKNAGGAREAIRPTDPKRLQKSRRRSLIQSLYADRRSLPGDDGPLRRATAGSTRLEKDCYLFRAVEPTAAQLLAGL
jgi:hypothetical protein